MRILMVSDVYFPRVNGVSTSIRTFRREISALGHQITLLAPRYAAEFNDDQDVLRVPSRGVPRDPEDRMMRRGQLDRLIPQLAKLHYDIVHIQTPFIAHYAGVHMAKKLGVPAVETYHTFFEEYLYHYVPFVPRNIMRLVARRVTNAQCNSVDRIISPSRAMQVALQNYGVRTPIEVLPTGLEASQFRLGNGANFRAKYGIGDRPALLYVGRVAHEKNIGFLLEMFKLVLPQTPNALLLIVGEGPAQEHLRAMAKSLGIVDSVKFIGYLDRDTELLDCYRSGDLFVFASRTETQGLVLLEALAQGTPVVSTMHMGTRDVLEHARGVRIVNEDAPEFAAAACALLRDKRERDRLSAEAPSEAQKWSSREMAERLVRCYAATIESRRSNAPANAMMTAR